MDRELNLLNRQKVEHFRSKLSGYLTKCLIIITVIATIKLKASMLKRILVISWSLVAIAKYFIEGKRVVKHQHCSCTSLCMALI